jgi:hypothetical protein
MKFIYTAFFICFLVSFCSMAQGVVVVFSEDGDPFYLVLNGVKQNPTPQTNVRVDGLSAPYYKAKIIFADAAKGELGSNVITQDAYAKNYMENTYRIKKNKKGESKLRMFSSVPVPPTYNPPPDMYVAHYGAPPPPPSDLSINANAQTNTGTVSIGVAGVNTTIAAPDRNSGQIGVNVNGTNVRVGVNANGTGNVNVNANQRPTPGQPAAYTPPVREDMYNDNPDCRWPMHRLEFNALLEKMRKENFTPGRVNAAQQALATNCLSTDEVIEICRVMNDDYASFTFAKNAYPRVTDRKNYRRVPYILIIEQNRIDLNKFIDNGGRE